MSARSCETSLLGFLVVLACSLVGCTREDSRGDKRGLRVSVDAGSPPWQAEGRAPAAPLGMVWIPPGPLIAGTPPGGFPRLAEQELPGEQVMLGGFFIDVFAYPNEEGAIPRTGLTLQQAAQACEERGKRLCSELEWERACKGPRNLTYEYGDTYRAEPCLTGTDSRMLPSGYRFACRSEFGVRDMHGGVWEWTESPWGRGSSADLYAIRGGNSREGELTGRCANARPRAPGSAAPDIGFRCCKGDRAQVSVELSLERGPTLSELGRPERSVAAALEALVPDSVRTTLAEQGSYEVTQAWEWRPVANERLSLGGGCSGKGSRRCGVVIARFAQGQSELVAWVSSGSYPPGVRTFSEPKTIYVYGIDTRGQYRQAVLFEWGRVRMGELQRRSPKDQRWRAQAEGSAGARAPR